MGGVVLGIQRRTHTLGLGVAGLIKTWDLRMIVRTTWRKAFVAEDSFGNLGSLNLMVISIRKSKITEYEKL